MNKHYMSKDDGPIVQVNLNAWGRYRADGYIFRTKAEYDAQANDTKAAPVVVADEPKPAAKKKSKKKKKKST